ncbi:putative lipid transporter atnI [Fusarium oxysporum f. sp. albedinis]|nr:putative lipid transporter atnI [Fusarium oxysporum f. sp. albedinis]
MPVFPTPLPCAFSRAYNYTLAYWVADCKGLSKKVGARPRKSNPEKFPSPKGCGSTRRVPSAAPFNFRFSTPKPLNSAVGRRLDFLYEYVPLPGTDKDHAERNMLRLTSADRSVIAYDLSGVCPALIISNGIKPQTEGFVASAGT